MEESETNINDLEDDIIEEIEELEIAEEFEKNNNGKYIILFNREYKKC